MKQLYKEKRKTISEVLEKVKSNDHIVSALAAAEPVAFFSNLHKIHNRVENVCISTCLPMGDYPYFNDERYKDSFAMEGWFYTKALRKAQKRGQCSYIPNHLHLAGTNRLSHRSVNIFAGTASPVDEHGYISMGLSATYEREMVEQADYVFLEVNPNVPRTFGDTTVHLSEVDAIVETDYPISELPNPQPNEKDNKIGAYIAEHVEDGSTIQLGIGGIPNAVAKALANKKDLGIHTEMLTDGMVDLIQNGIVTGKHKTLYKNKSIATFALGSKKLYDFINNNPSIGILGGKHVNDPYVIGQNHKMVSVNTTIEIDLTGQCCSESIGYRQFSGTGGQSDTAVGAQISQGGKSFIALYATTDIKQSDGKKQTISKIVSRLKHGAAVTLSRNDVDYVVTEYGVVRLKGASVRERARKLISIAHPKFREKLLFEARELGFL